jgi:predicted Zn-dependent protease
VANHELGHVLGLDHTAGAADAVCIMNDAGGKMATVDTERGTLCDDERRHVARRLGVALPERTELDWRWIETGKAR